MNPAGCAIFPLRKTDWPYTKLILHIALFIIQLIYILYVGLNVIVFLNDGTIIQCLLVRGNFEGIIAKWDTTNEVPEESRDSFLLSVIFFVERHRIRLLCAALRRTGFCLLVQRLDAPVYNFLAARRISFFLLVFDVSSGMLIY